MRQFSDADLNKMAEETHVHVYLELYDSGKRHPVTGYQHRLFRCKTCGHQRSVEIRTGEEEL